MVYKHLVVHPKNATIPAQAACAGARQNKFSEMEGLIWEKGFAKRNLGKENMEALAAEAGLDVNRFKADMAGACVKQVANDIAEMRKVGAGGTPAFFINGRFLGGARPIDQFQKLIDEELKKANDRISKGQATVDNYYNEFVIKRGKKEI